MKIQRSVLERIIDEELVRFIKKQQLSEAGPDLGTVLDDVPPSEEMPPDEMGPLEDPMPGEATDIEDPADPDLDAMAAGEELGDETDSIADQLMGKTVETIEHVPESETVPGAQELVFRFQGLEDSFRVIITKSGDVKFFFKGLHSDLGDASEVPPEEEEDELEGEDIPGEEEEEELDLTSPPLPTDDGGMDDPEIPRS